MSEKKGVATGEKLNLANLAGYQDGAVVSRTVVDKPVGTITAFAFDAGEGLSEHTAPYDAFVQVLDGEAEVNIEGKVQTVSAGEIAAALRYLIDARSVTGQMIAVDGGQHLAWRTPDIIGP